MGRRMLLISAAMLALAGCGGSSSNGEAKKSALAVVADAQKAALNASSVHVVGTITDNGTPLSVDLVIVKGKGGKGTLSEKGVKFEIVRIGSDAYIKGSSAFLEKFAGATAASLFHDKWLKASATSGQLAPLSPLTDETKLFNAALRQHGKLANKGETDYQSQKVVQIDDTTQGGTLYVAATGDPYPVALRGGAQQGRLTFTDWNADVTVEAPKGAVDLSSLGK